ncbi:RNA polymerase sigma-70 factor, ECF subfamily [Chitinophaga costaii]|uniref:RNA polymerase sigma-70 factor, ECF subfamily n=1 Tax=Chitinophaga costaii TaxID=1335309 RepID=A0A1C4E845_9BACT|nr:sigma-70 family RNA polymerase sigma factor [Chitinophaga costaii]SCC39789.1 RNA polymerase sigma-70 factor, ECF subfamily [Chitinophaga costaii]
MKENELQDLLVRLKGGDRNAFTRLYHHFFKSIYVKVFALVKDNGITDELVQDIFLKIWQKREEINLELHFNAYLFKVAQNQVFDFFRKAAKDAKLTAHLMNNAIVQYFHSDVQLEAKENEKFLHEAIAQLSPQRKQIFIYCKLEGNSYKDAATKFNISVATVNSHITASLKFIREFLLNKNKTAAVIFACTTIAELLTQKP